METDRLWIALLAGGGEEGRCIWLKDCFGVHWQVVDVAETDVERRCRRHQPTDSGRLMTMKKIDIAALERAFASG